ncbi:cytochrome c [Erythromicrobium ramosum]|uniref:C-type cytochrome n=1 Tax=Erythrobacter ramosus TaxID=35811 RepID=A0A6I4UHV7_9SPHN|nr:cytochrome c family protein [Erythrobacter ramosus]MBB3774256.1 cytochrome c [Erythrobacter ramosus]MXP38086.1 c-type cytochrome [Erythrobacter ramosus]
MTQDNSSQDNAASQTGGGDLFNTAAGWVLFAGVVGLGLAQLSKGYFHGDKPDRPEKLGYVIEGAVEEGSGPAEASIADALNAMPAAELVAAGEKAFAKCQSCHTINAGGANGIGPNLHGTMGKAVASHAGFAYSAELKAVGGTWDWDKMDTWLKNPKGMVSGTKMSFAGLGKVEDRAAIAAYLNAQGSNLPFPAAAAPAAAAEGEAAAAEGEAEAVATAEAGTDPAAATE